jgi:ABC-type transporter lipoprotein component MlaA
MMNARRRTIQGARKYLTLFALMAFVVSSAGCLCGGAKEPALSSEPPVVQNVETVDWEDEEFPNADPYEKANRKRYTRNQKIEKCCVDPLAQSYLKRVPGGMQKRFRLFRLNLGEPLNFINQYLQLRLKDGTVSTTRFGVNTIFGLLGFYDPATKIGLKRIRSDTGQTMYRYGVPKGPYLVLPLVGPSTARDGLGTVFDFFLRPDTYLLSPAGQLLWIGSEGVVRKSEVMDQLELLRKNSVDEYAMIRSAYMMDRMSWLRGRELTDEELDTLLNFE